MVSNGVLPDFFWISQDTNVGFCCHHLLLSSAKNGQKIHVRSRVTCKLAIIGLRPVMFYIFEICFFLFSVKYCFGFEPDDIPDVYLEDRHLGMCVLDFLIGMVVAWRRDCSFRWCYNNMFWLCYVKIFLEYSSNRKKQPTIN